MGYRLLNEAGDMYAVVITDEGGVRRRLDFSKPELTVGRVQGNDIVLSKRNVSKQHARLTLKGDHAVVMDLDSTNGTWVNGRKITGPHPLKQGDKIYIADFILTVEPARSEGEKKSAAPRVSEPPPLPAREPPPAQSSIPAQSAPATDASDVKAAAPARTNLPPDLEDRVTDAPPSPPSTKRAAPAADPLRALLRRLADRIDLDEIDPAAMKSQQRWSATRAAIAETFLAMQKDGSVGADVDMRHVAHVALHEAVGLGALDDLLSDESVRAVVVNGPNRVFADKGEGLETVPGSFSSQEALHRVARRLALQIGQSLEARPVLHGRLEFGPRLTILQAPLVSGGPLIELRMADSRSLEELAEDGWMSADAATHLAKAVAECRNIVVAGPRGSGVQALLGALARELPQTESTVVVEAAPQLDLDRERVVSLTATPGSLSLAEAIDHGTRLLCDHLVIADLGAAETMAAFEAVLGREPGHLLGVHCWSHRGALEGLLLAASCGGANRASVAELIGSAIDLVVATERGPQGPRVAGVLEIQGHEGGDVSFESVPF